MKNGKAPGLDGLPVDFYKAYWHLLGEDLLTVLSDSLDKGKLSLTCRRAVLTLLPKKGDLKEIKKIGGQFLYYALITRFFSKALANRLKKVIGQVIHIGQSYCVPNRSIVDNISLI